MADLYPLSKQKGIEHLQVVKQIGQGGMATVWKVLHINHNVPLALKVASFLPKDKFQYQEQLDLELLTLAQLDHPNVIRLLDFGRITQKDAENFDFLEGSSWLLFEYVKGQSIIEQCQKNDWFFVRQMMSQLLEALTHIHARGIIHRDICPGNVLWSFKERCLKLIDFGIALQKDQSEDPFAGYGSYGYSPPEVTDGGEIGPWSDLYSAGYLFSLMLSHLESLPKGLYAWLSKLTHPNISHRFQRAADALYAFSQLPSLLSDNIENEIQQLKPSSTDQNPVTLTIPLDSTPPPPFNVKLKEPNEQDLKQFIPPFPKDWRRIQKSTVALNWAIPSISLLPLQLPKIQGREDEQNWLWENLKTVVQTKQSRIISLKGETGLGISRLLLWFGHRAHETGVADIHQISTPALELDELKKASKIRTQLVLFDGYPEEQFPALPQLNFPILFVIGRAKSTAQDCKTLYPLPKKDWFVLLSSFATLNPFPASWIALQTKGHPENLRKMLISLLENKTLIQGYQNLIWVKKPPPPVLNFEIIDSSLQEIEEDIFEGIEAVNLFTLDRIKDFLLQFPIQEVAERFCSVWDKLCRIALALEDQDLMKALLKETQFYPYVKIDSLFESKRKTVRIHQRLDQLEKADQIIEEILRAMTDTTTRNYLLTYWEYAYQSYLQGHYQIAYDRYKFIYERSRETNHPRMTAHAIGGMAFSLTYMGYFSSSLALMKEVETRTHESKIDFTLASIQELYTLTYLGLSRLKKARKHVFKALQIHKKQGKTKPINSTMLWLQVEHNRQNKEKVHEILEELNHRLSDIERDIQGYLYLFYFVYSSDEMTKQHYLEQHILSMKEQPSADSLLGVFYLDAIEQNAENAQFRSSLIQAYTQFWDQVGWDIAARWKCKPFP